MEAPPVAMRAVTGEGGQAPNLAAAEALDLHDIGAEVGELLAGARDGHAVPDLDHADPRPGLLHARSH